MAKCMAWSYSSMICVTKWNVSYFVVNKLFLIYSSCNYSYSRIFTNVVWNSIRIASICLIIIISSVNVNVTTIFK